MIRMEHRAILVFVFLMGCARSAPPAGKVGAGGEQRDRNAAEQATLTDSQKAEIAKADQAIAEYTAMIERDPDHARDAYVNRGEAYRRKRAVIGGGELDKAIADFTAALKLAPDDASIYFKRCLAHFDKDNFPDDYRKGMADYMEAIRRDSQLAQSFNHLPAEYPEDGSAIYPFYLRDLARASRAIELDPKKAKAYDDRANVYQELAAYDLAIADYCEAFRLDPTNLRRYSLRGFCYLSNGDYDNAIADFDEAIRHDPKDTDAYYDYYHRGLAHLAQNEYDKAIADFTEAIRLDPKAVDAYTNRGSAYTEQSPYDKAITDKAIADYNEAIRLDPKCADAYQGRGRVHYLRGVDCSLEQPNKAKEEFDKAIAECTEAIRLDPNNANAYFTRARACRDNRQLEKAISDFSALIRGSPSDSKSFYVYERGLLFLETKQFAEAARDFSEVIRLESTPEEKARQGDAYVFNQAWHYVHRGQAYAGQKDYDKAIADYQEANRIYDDPDGFDGAYDALGWLFATCPDAKVRDGKKALEYAKQACEMNDWTDPNQFDVLAAAYAENGNFAEAVKWLQKALESPDFSRDRLEKAQSRLKLYQAGKPYRDE